MDKISKEQIPMLVARFVEHQDEFANLSFKDAEFAINSPAEAIKIWLSAIRARHHLPKQASMSEVNTVLRLISDDGTIVLKPVDGKRLIYTASDVFQAGIDKDYVKWCIRKPGVPTPETAVQVHEMLSDATLITMFGVLPGSWEEKFLSQNQLIDFCETKSVWLCPGGNSTFFLIKKDEKKPINEDHIEDNLAVVRVAIVPEGLFAHIHQLEGPAWIGEHKHRLVCRSGKL